MKGFNQSYVGPREDVLNLIPLNSKNVLDVGCSTGVLGSSVKQKTGAKVTGIDVSEEMGKVAKTKLDAVYIGSVEDKRLLMNLKGAKFDAIIFADVLEHLENPWEVLINFVKFLSSSGVVIVSMPNVRHLDTLYSLFIKGTWPYRKRGIHDKTHLRYFTRQTVIDLFNEAGLEIEFMTANYRFIDAPHPINNYAKYFALPFVKDFLAYQYLVRGVKT